jgi:putative heme-binding domain-containing protein
MPKKTRPLNHFNCLSRVLIVVLIAIVPVARTSADQVDWIWSESREGDRVAGVQLEKEFTIEKTSIDSAKLRVAVDFAEAAISINGTELAVANREKHDIRGVNVTRWLQGGKNTVSVQAKRLGGPAAMATELALTQNSGEVRRICSDTTWRNAGTGQGVRSFGRADVEPWWNIVRRPVIGAFDEYNQQVRRTVGATRPQVPEAFALEVIHSGGEKDGSWVSLEIDPQGRYVMGEERKGILRLTPGASPNDEPVLERIDDTLQAVHGLLFANDSLYAVANASKGLFRLRDTDGDDQFDEVVQLHSIPGNAGDHGRHALALGKSGELYSIHGDAVTVPDGFSSLVPATREFGESRKPLAGHLARTDADGKRWEVVASGLRNPFGVAFNRDGELFTYDADSEAHTGLPWYRPTRILHLVPGADYGWRRSDREIWPASWPDGLPAVTNIGEGSPTGVLSGARSQFPPAYQNALFALDWTYGRILAIHLVPQGASYVAHPEVFLSGRPLNVVDLDFDRDGSMVFVTGGQGTRSTLYRLLYVGPKADPRAETAQEIARSRYSEKMRALRRDLESHFKSDTDEAVGVAWANLDHVDPWIRHAARIVLEHQPLDHWKGRALEESQPGRALPALLALVRVAPADADEAIQSRLYQIEIAGVRPWLQLTAVRIATQIRQHDRTKLLRHFEPIYPTGEHAIDRELCELLVKHESEKVIDATLRILASEPRQEDAFHYLMALSQARSGWTSDSRRSYFSLLTGAQLYKGDRGLPGVVNAMQQAALENVPDADRAEFANMLARNNDPDPDPDPADKIPPRAFVKNWTVSELRPTPADRAYEPDLDRGKALFRGALCSQCHRFGTAGKPSGPDLTAVAARFGRQDLLTAIIDPSKDIGANHRSHVITMRDGKKHLGRVVWNGFRNSTLHIAPNPMALDQVVKIAKRDIAAHEESPVSPMPPGLLNTMTREEVLDLLAFLGIGD